MGWKQNQRRLAVASLRKAARGCGVPKHGQGGWGTVGNDAGRRAVQALADACAASSGPGPTKAAAQDSLRRFLATFFPQPTGPATTAASKAKARGKAKGKAQAKALRRAQADASGEDKQLSVAPAVGTDPPTGGSLGITLWAPRLAGGDPVQC